MRYIIIFSIILVIVFGVGLGLDTAYSQNESIPAWIKNIAGYWANDEIEDSEFFILIQWLIDRQVITIPNNSEFVNQLQNEISELENEIAQIKHENKQPSPTNEKSNLVKPKNPDIIYDQEKISVLTNDSTYLEGDTIIISGQVSEIIGEAPVIIHIFHESTYIHVSQITVAHDGAFSETIIAEGSLWENPGEYIVRASYKDQITETGFSYTPKSELIETATNFEVNVGSYGTFDVEYGIIGGTVENMTIDADSFSLIVKIDSHIDGSITLQLPRAFFDSKKFNGSDDIFLLLIDGIEHSYEQLSVDSKTRTIKIAFDKSNSDIEIIGTDVIS